MKKERQKMSVANRAKQFAPFAAVSGLEVALRKKEEEHKQKLDTIVVGVIDPEKSEVVEISSI